MLIGITGCLGSGKSHILKLISHHFHYQTYSCDEFVKEAYLDNEIKKKLDKSFNCLINDQVDKDIIKNNLNDDNTQKLNNIIHPYVILKIKNIAIKAKNELIFIEVPLLFEANLTNLFDYTIAISVNDNLRHKMLEKRDVRQYQNMIKLEQQQFDNDTKVKLANFVINSNYDEVENLKQLEVIIQKINS